MLFVVSPTHSRTAATRRAITALAAASLLAGLPLTAASQSDGVTQTPTVLAGGTFITADEAKKLIYKKAAMVIDTRSPVNFGKSHLPTAVSIAYKENSDKTPSFDAAADQFDLARLPADKNAAVIIYSDGPMGWKSYKGAVVAIKGGYRDVMYMRGGWAEWSEKGLPSEK
jgi:rhodanese-related sulfurtransferase